MMIEKEAKAVISEKIRSTGFFLDAVNNLFIPFMICSSLK